MSHRGQYTDSASADNPQDVAPNWQSIGKVLAREVAPEVARLVRERQEGGK